MSPVASQAISAADALCLNCAICCNGVLFKDVELQADDAMAPLIEAGLPLKQALRKTCLPQPCAALAGCRCRVYADRPARCREFECALFKSYQSGEIDSAAALRTIRLALRKADRVRQLLEELGDADDKLALSLRFKRTRRRIEGKECDETTAARFGELALAVHDLNWLLRTKFYPGREE